MLKKHSSQPTQFNQTNTMNPLRHNIGGSILPSSSPQVLQPMPYHGGVLQVVPDYAADTHHLQFDGKTIASHPNGYSCHCLAQRMISDTPARVQSQAKYIVDCGGSVDFDLLAAIHP